MADMSKAEKLAAARKRLKEYQQKGKDHQPSGNKNSGKKSTLRQVHEIEGSSTIQENTVFDSGPSIPTYSENMSNSSEGTHISTTNMNGGAQITAEMPSNFYQESPPMSAPASSNTCDYFTSNPHQASGREITNTSIHHVGVIEQEVQNNTFKEYSGIFSMNSQPFSASIATFPSFTMSEGTLPGNTYFSDNAVARDFFDNFSANRQNPFPDNTTTATVEPTNTNTIIAASDFNVSNNVTSMVNTEQLQQAPQSVETPQFVSQEPETSFVINNKESHLQETMLVQNTGEVSPQKAEKEETTLQEVPLVTQMEEFPQELPERQASEETNVSEQSAGVLSASESLRQLSLQMNGLIDESVLNGKGQGQGSELEWRNQELAALLATEQQKSQQLELQLKEYQSRLCQIQLEMDQMRTESEARVTRELGPIQEQLQLHVRTVGILVGEKTELQAALTKSQNMAKQKAGEAEELQGRLKASRHKVSELEKEVSTLQESHEKLERTTREISSELEKLKTEQASIIKTLAEKDEEVSELRQKLLTKTNDCVGLQRELQEKQSQLSLSQLRVQQLSTTDTSEVDGQLEALHQQKVSLEKQVAELQQTIKSVGAERDQASQQYQQYVQQLNGQLQSLAFKVESLSAENEQLTNREQSLVKHVSDLEKQIQQQNQRRRESPPRRQPQDVAAMQELEAKVKALENEKQGIAERLQSQVQENESIKQELEERLNKIEELESALERVQGDQPDKDKLLAAMESDKVAAARAVGQNQRLKQQLEELQDGFVKMSNDKLVLTENLQHEQHICKEQGERLAQQEDELKELRKQLSEKEQELLQNSNELKNQMLQQSQITDRMRHYEAHGQVHEILQQELEQAKERIQALSAQNSELRTLLAQQSTQDSGSSSGAGSLDDGRKDEMLATLSASVRQLELERNQLLGRLQQKEQNQTQEDSPVSEMKEGSSRDDPPKDYETMKTAMEQLEERFTRTMKEVADLSDEKQRLEHIVLQLQGETETIGEYIALYQVQRNILRQRAQEKDEQLTKLARDREEMRNKLGELNELVHQLVTEKEAIRKIDHGVSMPEKAEETPVISSISAEEGVPNGEIVEVEVAKEVNGETTLTPPPTEQQADTAGKIMALLSEIGTSSLVDPQQCSENFHPCPWCSGRLITV